MRQGSRRHYVLLIVAAACVIYAVSSGIRANLGIMLLPVVGESGLGYAEVSFAIALGQFVYGLSQVFFGIMALRTSNRAVLLSGCALMLAGLALTPLSHTALSLSLTLGVAFHLGTGATCFGIVMSVAVPVMGERRAVWASGIINAGTGMGTVLLAPLMGVLTARFGAFGTLEILCLPVILCVIPSLWLASRPGVLSLKARERLERSHSIPLQSALALALSDGYFMRLCLSFIACGFNLGIIYTHFFSQLTSAGMSSHAASLLYGAVGAATVVGAILTGMACARITSRRTLVLTYLLTAVLICAPAAMTRENTLMLVAVALGAGFFSDAPIAPTSDLVSRRFGPEYLGVLFGAAFICVQLGGFMSSSLGGWLVEEGFGYRALWALDGIMCLISAFIVVGLGRKHAGTRRATVVNHSHPMPLSWR